MTAAVVFLLFLDLILIFYLLKKLKPKEIKEDLLFELHEERSMLESLQTKTKQMLEKSKNEHKEQIAKMHQLVSETEQEVKRCKKALTSNLEYSLKELGSALEKPINQIEKKKGSLNILLKNIEKEKKLLGSLLERTEQLSKFLCENISYEEVVKEIEGKKLDTARHLLSQGVRPEKISADLGLSFQEVKLLVLSDGSAQV